MTNHTVGYVGLDHHHAEPYLRTLESLPVSVECACEPNPDFDVTSVSALGDVTVYEDFERMLTNEQFDAVFMTLPNRDTPDAIRLALSAGVHAFTEKPAARTASELDPVVESASDAESTVCVSYPWQHHPISRKLASLIDDGFFGDVRAFDARFVASQLEFRDTSHFIFDADASRGGILQWLGIHWLQLLSHLLDERIVRVNATTADAEAADVDVEAGATLQLETSGGALGTLQCGYYLADDLYDTRIDIYGSEGRSSWNPMGRRFGFEGETTLELDDASGEWESTPHRTITHDYDPEPGYGGAWGKRFVREFFEACESGGTPPVTLSDALTVLRILDAAYESADRGEWVAVRDGPR